MENLDTRRMKRVMDRLYPERPPVPGPPPPMPPPPDPPPPPAEACGLLESEQELQRDLHRAVRGSRQAARSLAGVLKRSENRAAHLRTECFLAGRLPPPERRTAGPFGTAAALRRAWRELEALSGRYRTAAQDPRQGERYREYGEQCRRDAQSVHNALNRLLR